MFRIILEHAYLNDIDIYEYMKSIYRNDTKIINNLTIHDIYRMPDDASPIDCEYEINKNAYTLMEEVGRVKGLFLNYFNEEKMISPYRFIEWAISCDSIKVPQQMIAWKATQDKKAGQQDIAAALTALAAKDAEMIALKTELGQAQQEKAALQAELEKTRAELKKARCAAPFQGMTPQQKAALARSEKAFNAWKPAIAAMIEIATVIGKEGPKERQTPDLYVYFNERDIAITDEQMKLFRKALPAEYKDTEGGPVGKI